MFKGTNGNGAPRTQEMNSPDRLNRIVDGTEIEGSFVSDSNIRIDGKVKGTIVTKGRLVVGVTGSIEGDVTCHNADIEGTINGTVKVAEILSLKSTAKIDGQVHTGKLAVEPGAEINATVDMGSYQPTSTPNGSKQSEPKAEAVPAEKDTVDVG